MKGLVSPRLVVAQVPIPDGVVGGAGDAQETFLALAQFFLNVLASRDVLAGGEESRLVDGRHRVPQDALVRAVLAANAHLGAPHDFSLAEPLDDFNCPGAIVRVHQIGHWQRQHFAARVAKRAGRDRPQFLQVAVEAADAGQAQQFLKQPIALAQAGPQGSFVRRCASAHVRTQFQPWGFSSAWPQRGARLACAPRPERIPRTQLPSVKSNFVVVRRVSQPGQFVYGTPNGSRAGRGRPLAGLRHAGREAILRGVRRCDEQSKPIAHPHARAMGDPPPAGRQVERGGARLVESQNCARGNLEHATDCLLGGNQRDRQRHFDAQQFATIVDRRFALQANAPAARRAGASRASVRRGALCRDCLLRCHRRSSTPARATSRRRIPTVDRRSATPATRLRVCDRRWRAPGAVARLRGRTRRGSELREDPHRRHGTILGRELAGQESLAELLRERRKPARLRRVRAVVPVRQHARRCDDDHHRRALANRQQHDQARSVCAIAQTQRAERLGLSDGQLAAAVERPRESPASAGHGRLAGGVHVVCQLGHELVLELSRRHGADSGGWQVAGPDEGLRRRYRPILWRTLHNPAAQDDLICRPQWTKISPASLLFASTPAASRPGEHSVFSSNGSLVNGPCAVFDQIEKLKQDFTDKYVVVDASIPELARFGGHVGQVKTVNMNGRALVEFDAWNNIGWYDIEPAS